MLSIQSVAQHVSPPLHLHTTYHLLTVSGAASRWPHAHCLHTYQDHIIYSVTLHMMTRCRHNNNKHFEPVLVCCGFFFKTQKLLGCCKVAAR